MQLDPELYRNFTQRPFLGCILAASLVLTACTPMPPKPEQAVPTYQKPAVDPDLVTMPGYDKSLAGNSLMGVKPMTLDELNHCAVKIDSIHKDSKHYQAEGADIKHKKAELLAQQRKLEAQRANVNTYNAKDVNAFNAKGKNLMTRIKAHNSHVKSLNNEITQMNSRVNDFKTNCAERVYRSSDKLKLSLALQKAIESSSTTSDIPLLDEEPVGTE